MKNWEVHVDKNQVYFFFEAADAAVDENGKLVPLGICCVLNYEISPTEEGLNKISNTIITEGISGMSKHKLSPITSEAYYKYAELEKKRKAYI